MLGIDRKTGFSAYFLAINRGKKSLTLDLQVSRQGREIALRLARDCDVVAHNFRPGVMEKLGPRLRGRSRRRTRSVIYASASAFGTKGPLAQARQRHPGAGDERPHERHRRRRKPRCPPAQRSPTTSARSPWRLASSSALFARERTGDGQAVETSLLGGMLAAQSWELTHYMMTGENPPKAGRGHTHLLWQWYTFRTGDGWMAVGGVDPSRWTEFCEAIGRPELETDPRFDYAGKRIRDRHELNALLDEHFSTRPTAALAAAHLKPQISSAPRCLTTPRSPRTSRCAPTATCSR